jgi:chromosome segregation ATPase
VLGCFTDGTVHVLQVERADLAPVMTVATAHEMLHTAYAELSVAERRRVNALLDAEFAALHDPDIEEHVAAYDDEDSNARHNELHSILGTEVHTLRPALERYYARYFRDRARVVDANDRYLAVFRPVKERFTQLQSELDAMQPQLDELSARIDGGAARAQNLSGQINALRAQGRIAESNDLVDAQNAAADEANALIDEYNALVAAFNIRVDEYNALRENELGLLNSVSAVPLAPR